MSVSPRRLTLPLCTLASPPLFLLYRETTVCGTPAGCRTVALAGYAVLALLVPVGAWLVASAVATGRGPGWVAPRPDDHTLAALGGIVAGLVAYLLAATVGVVPGWLDVLLAPVASLLGLPLVIVSSMLIGFGRTLGEPTTTVQRLVVLAGIALTGAWWYLLAATAARGMSRVNEQRD